MGDAPCRVVACIRVGLHCQALLYDVQRLLPVLLRKMDASSSCHGVFCRRLRQVPALLCSVGWDRTGRCDRTKAIISETTGADDDMHRAVSSMLRPMDRASMVPALYEVLLLVNHSMNNFIAGLTADPAPNQTIQPRDPSALRHSGRQRKRMHAARQLVLEQLQSEHPRHRHQPASISQRRGCIAGGRRITPWHTGIGFSMQPA